MSRDIAEAIEIACTRGIREAQREGLNPTRRALEIASWVSLETGVRPYKVDSVELVAFIKNSDPTGDAEADDLAAAIIERFSLEDY